MASSAPSSNLLVLLGLGIAGIILISRRLRRVIKEDFGAFVQRFELLPPPPPQPPKAPHPLNAINFVVADIFDISGHVTGFGNPDWATTHEPATRTSPVITALVEAGATCVGKTVIDELAYSLSGENKHFGAPTNPVAPDHVPGGCSSGSAVAVASGLVDFSLGIDTIGGVRIPGGYCGIFAFRPSYGAISSVGVVPVSPSLDTIGLFAKDFALLSRVAHVLLQLSYADVRHPRQIIIADDCFQFLKIPKARLTQVVTKSVEKKFGKQLLTYSNLGDYLSSRVSNLKQLQNGKKRNDDSKTTLLALANTMQSLYKTEFRNNHDKWRQTAKPTLNSYILGQMSDSLDDNNGDLEYCQSVRNEVRMALNDLLKDDKILVLPTVLGPPPKLNSREATSQDYWTHTLCLTAISSLSGCCQITVPLGLHEKFPVSISFVARHGGDRFLLDTVKTIYPFLQEQVDIFLNSSNSSSSSNKEEAAEIAKEKGNQAYKDKQWQKAVHQYTEAIKLYGKNATYFSNRAAAYLKMGSYHQAEADCTMAISLDKKNVKAYLRRGTSREMLGYYKDAIEDFKYALVLEPTNKTANNALGRLKNFFQ